MKPDQDPKKAPGGLQETPGEHSKRNLTSSRIDWNSKANQKLSPAQKQIADILATGYFTSRQLSMRTGYFAPRAVISNLKKKGIPVREMHFKRRNTGERFKAYTIEAKELRMKFEEEDETEKSPRTSTTGGAKHISEILDQPQFQHLKKDGKK